MPHARHWVTVSGPVTLTATGSSRTLPGGMFPRSDTRSGIGTGRLLVPVAALVLLQGCATYVYQTETKALHDTVTAATRAFEAAAAEHDRARQENRHWKLVAERWTFEASPECGKLVVLVKGNPPVSSDKHKELLKACRLFRADVSGDTPEEVRIEPDTEHALAGARALRDYATALVQLTTAEDESTLQAAGVEVAEKADRVRLLARDGTGASTESSPDKRPGAVARLLVTLRLAALSGKKLRILRETVEGSHDAVKLLAATVQEGDTSTFRGVIEERRAALDGSIQRLAEATDGGTAKAVRKAQAEVVERFDAFRQVVSIPPQERFAGIAAAHKRLRERVMEPNVRQSLEFLEGLAALREASQKARDALTE